MLILQEVKREIQLIRISATPNMLHVTRIVLPRSLTPTVKKGRENGRGDTYSGRPGFPEWLPRKGLLP